MRTSACGLASTIAVAIDQILRLAPSISGPIEPVVSSTNATSTIGFAVALAGKANGAIRNARARALTRLGNMNHPSVQFSPGRMFPGFHGWGRREMGLAIGAIAA